MEPGASFLVRRISFLGLQRKGRVLFFRRGSLASQETFVGDLIAFWLF